jgi:lysyl-tRNA synthetase class 2
VPEETSPPGQESEPEQIRVRKDKRERLLAEGRPPYPVTVPRTHSLREVRAGWAHLETGEETDDVVGVAGRVVFVRNTGKLCFATLQEGLSLDDPGVRLQVMLSLNEVGPAALASWKADVDLGDFVFVQGRVISSRRGELSVLASAWEMASKALRPMPTLHRELSDETRVRQRYADLAVREAAREMVRTRAAVTRSIRETLHRDGYVEIETPVLQLVHGGAHARPFRTHLNAFDTDMTLRIALELFLKRAVVGGVEKVYELGRIFRNEGIDSTHSAEFTMLEFYQAWGDQRTVAAVLQQIITDVADLLGSRQIETPAGVIDLDGEWPWLGVYPGLSAVLGEEISPATDVGHLRRIVDQHGVEADPSWDAEKLVIELFGELVEPTLIQPTFVIDYPKALSPFAKDHRSKPGLVERFEVFANGMEVGNAFTELNDPDEQRARFEAQVRLAEAGDEETTPYDEVFVQALEHGMPPTGGIGIGIDRLVLLMTGHHSIREIVLFPAMRD